MDTTKRNCFVLMPFDKGRRAIYDHAIRPAAEAAGFECHRADERVKVGAIIDQIIQSIFKADIIVADLSKHNPNVFYELGIAHTVGNKTIMICDVREELPFNLNAYWVIFYENTFEGGIALKEELTKALSESTMQEPGPTNPVQHFRPVFYATPLQEQAKLEAEIRACRIRTETLEKEKLSGELRNLMLTLPNYQFLHLRYLTLADAYYYKKIPAFVEELRKLRALELVRTKGGIKIGEIPETGDLKDYVEITDLAKQVLEELFRLTNPPEE